MLALQLCALATLGLDPSSDSEYGIYILILILILIQQSFAAISSVQRLRVFNVCVVQAHPYFLPIRNAESSRTRTH